MKILGIDTSSDLNGVGLIDGDRVLADFTWDAMNNSLQQIILNIDSVLKEKGFTLADIDGLAVGIGPGSWTGVRVGVTVSKMFAYTLNKPICGVSSLEALAYQAKDSHSLLCSIVDAGKGTVYSAFYRPQYGDPQYGNPQKRTVAKASANYVGDIDTLLLTIRENTIFLGKAAHLYRHIITEKLGSLASFGDQTEDNHRGSVVALLASPRLEKGKSDNALSMSPMYLKESTAKALWDQRRKFSGRG